MAPADKIQSPESPQGNKRKNLRAPIIVQKVLVDVGHKPFFGHAKNISRSGFFVATVNPKKPGDSFVVEIPLPPPINRSFQCQCEVIWNRQYVRNSPYEPGMGLKFMDLSQELSEAIELWVQQSSAEEDEAPDL